MQSLLIALDRIKRFTVERSADVSIRWCIDYTEL